MITIEVLKRDSRGKPTEVQLVGQSHDEDAIAILMALNHTLSGQGTSARFIGGEVTKMTFASKLSISS